MSLEALEHLFFDVFDIGELAPASHVAVFALNLHNEFFHQAQHLPVFFPEMLFANVDGRKRQSAQKDSKITKRNQNWIPKPAQTVVDSWHTIHHTKDRPAKTGSQNCDVGSL